ncbi:MAG: lipoprotein-releasing ABC transporter permease subunit [bacterium]|nr:lipoprotein-releasing ABC transporter permease subunit [bacterium]MDD5354132.1 lipoprotein-releasing ABC transporter permease subunit [bacterium]
MFELGVAWRYLKFRKEQMFLSLIGIISIAGVAVGVMALIITLSVMNGFQNDLRSKILGVNAHIVVTSQTGRGIENYNKLMQKIAENKRVLGTSPFVYAQAILKTSDGATGVVVKGVQPSKLLTVTNLSAYMKAGTLDKLVPGKPASKSKTAPVDGIVLGTELAQNLRVVLNDDLMLISSQGITSALGVVPLMKKYKVVGIFDSGMYEYDANLAFISLESAQNIFNAKNKATGIEVKTADFFTADQVVKELQESIGFPYWVRGWMAVNRNLFSALKLEKIAMFVILTLIVLVACFNIVGTLMMITIQKTRCIGIMRALGATRASIMKIFIGEGLIIGFFGLVLGMAGGWLGCVLLDKYKFIKLPGDIYYLDHLPVKMQLGDFSVIAIAALVISFLATIYPSYKASRLNPVEAIRYE